MFFIYLLSWKESKKELSEQLEKTKSEFELQISELQSKKEEIEAEFQQKSQSLQVFIIMNTITIITNN